MAETTIWWLLAGVLIALEMMTGTFYLLMLSLGMVFAAIAAHLGVTFTWQLVIAAAVGAASVIIFHAFKKKLPALRAESNPDVNMDIGEKLMIDNWRSDGSASVKYRGAMWTVEPSPGEMPTPGLHQIVEVKGNKLLVRKAS